MKTVLRKIFVTCVILLSVGIIHLPQAAARQFYVGPTGHRGNAPVVFYPQSQVLIYNRPTLVFPRVGSNDYLYQYDNIYGPEASAAGRMTHTVVNPPPQYYIYQH